MRIKAALRLIAAFSGMAILGCQGASDAFTVGQAYTVATDCHVCTDKATASAWQLNDLTSPEEEESEPLLARDACDNCIMIAKGATVTVLETDSPVLRVSVETDSPVLRVSVHRLSFRGWIWAENVSPQPSNDGH